MRERIAADKDEWNLNYGFLFGSIGVAAAIGSLYYARKDDQRQVEKQKDDDTLKYSTVQK